MRKKDLTGSVVQINPNKIADQNPGSVQDVLRGTPGLQIGADFSAKGTDASIQLRGKNSLGTSAGPMIVLDGMPFYGELSEINPDDIGQIDVLKDASSAAIYGAKAAAGVIIITTKKGKTGKPVINVSANLSARNKSAYRDYFSASDYVRYLSDWNKMSYTYGQGENGLYGYYNAKNKEGQVLYPQGYYDDPSSLSSSDQDLWATNIGASGVGLAEGESIMGLYARRLGMTNSQNVYDNFLAGKTVDWDDETFRTGFNQDYNASISGATDNVNYYMSLGYVNNQGAVQGNVGPIARAHFQREEPGAVLPCPSEQGAHQGFCRPLPPEIRAYGHIIHVTFIQNHMHARISHHAVFGGGGHTEHRLGILQLLLQGFLAPRVGKTRPFQRCNGHDVFLPHGNNAQHEGSSSLRYKRKSNSVSVSRWESASSRRLPSSPVFQ